MRSPWFWVGLGLFVAPFLPWGAGETGVEIIRRSWPGRVAVFLVFPAAAGFLVLAFPHQRWRTARGALFLLLGLAGTASYLAIGPGGLPQAGDARHPLLALCVTANACLALVAGAAALRRWCPVGSRAARLACGATSAAAATFLAVGVIHFLGPSARSYPQELLGLSRGREAGLAGQGATLLVGLGAAAAIGLGLWNAIGTRWRHGLAKWTIRCVVAVGIALVLWTLATAAIASRSRGASAFADATPVLAILVLHLSYAALIGGGASELAAGALGRPLATPTPIPTDPVTLAGKLHALKELHDRGFITDEDYDEQKRRLLVQL